MRVQARHHLRAFARRRGDALRGAGANIADGKYVAAAGLSAVFTGLGSGQYETIAVERYARARQPIFGSAPIKRSMCQIARRRKSHTRRGGQNHAHRRAPRQREAARNVRDLGRCGGRFVAMVVAESIAAAKDMAERVHIDYEPLPAVSRAVEAIKPGAPVLWNEAALDLPTHFAP
jgi:hypothetical protein